MWGCGNMWGYGNMMGWGGGGFGMIIWFVILIAIVAGIIWLLRSGGGQLSLPRRSSALDILEERYARGEINRDEYLEKKHDMSS